MQVDLDIGYFETISVHMKLDYAERYFKNALCEFSAVLILKSICATELAVISFADVTNTQM